MKTVASIFCGRRIACVKKVKSKDGFYKVYRAAAGRGKYLGEEWWTKDRGRLSIIRPGEDSWCDWKACLMDDPEGDEEQATNPYAHHQVIRAQAGALLDDQGGFLGSFEGEPLLAIAAYCLMM